MGNIDVQKIKYGSYGDCLRVTNGNIEFIAALELGPRIIRFGKVGGNNEFYEDVNDNINNTDKALADYYGDKGFWHIYGGHRLWTSPEIHPRTYYPDNRPVQYEILENGVVLQQEPQAENNVQLKIVATMADDGVVTVEHFITSLAAWDIKLAPWAITVMNVGGLEVVPQPTHKNGYLHNRTISLWDYSNMADKRVEWEKEYVLLKTTSDCECPFKLGISNTAGYVCYFNNNNLFVKMFDKFNSETEYPDNNVNYETYTCTHMTEIETVGKFSIIKPNETISHKEVWKLVTDVKRPETVDEIKETINKYI